MQLSTFLPNSLLKSPSPSVDEHKSRQDHWLNTNLIFDGAYFNLEQSDTYCPTIFVLLSGIYLWWAYFCLMVKPILV